MMIHSSTDVRRVFERPAARFIHFLAVSGGILVIFWLDMIAKLGIAVWALYILPLWYVSRLRVSSKTIFTTAAVCTALTILGWFLSPPGLDPWISFYNRAIGLALMWALAMMLMRASAFDEKLSAAQKVQAQLAAIVETSDDAIIGKSLEGIVSSWNRSAETMFGFTADEAIGKSITLVIPPDRQDEEGRIMERLKRGERIEQYETVRRRKDGGDVSVSLTLSPITDAENRLIGISSIVRDVTEKKRAEDTLRRQAVQLQEQTNHLHVVNEQLKKHTAALEDANKELEGFSYSVSHDLRAPIRTVHSFVRIIEEDHGSHLDPELARCLGVIAKAARQAGQLIDDLLDFSRLGRHALQRQPVNMVAVVHDVLADLRKDQDDHRANIAVAELPPCFGDRRLLKLVWMNLLSNALKYSQYQDNARIEIGWRQDDRRERMCTYYVKDNGVGFDMKYAHKLFGVFQRLHGKEEFEGTGVGLAIVQRIVHRHGGQVWAEGEVNAGATFYFTVERTAAS
ncbi:MAG TPA: PAS domain S-box protein [Nitrospiraceae bacterium]|nr:PAS domain S-box protein [Nitrospiraceae bacterium]